MKPMKYILILCFIVLMGSAFTYAAEGTDFILELLNAEMPENVVFGETAILADELQFSIPADWVEVTEYYDDEEVYSFLFEGTDAEGRNVVFIGVEGVSDVFSLEHSSYTDMKNDLIEAEISHIVSSLNGVDMIFAVDDELMSGLCLTKDADVFAFGFVSEDYDLEAIRESDKLKADMTAILLSMRAFDAAKLMSFDSSIWEQAERTKDTSTVEKPAPAAEKKAEQDQFFKEVTSGNGVTPKSHPIYLDETLVVYIPDDWREIEDEDSICTFIGTDDDNNWVTVAIDAVQTSNMTIEELEADSKEQLACCTTSANGIRYFTVLTRSALITTWLSDEGTVYRIYTCLEPEVGIRSEKLVGDLNQIMCGIRPVYEGELEQERAITMMADRDHSDETPISFSDAEFERMVRAALGRSGETPIYPSELEAIRNMSIRSGNMMFSPEIQTQTQYDQPEVLNLTDLRLFPNLLFLDITDMKCIGFETLAELTGLRELILIRTGLEDCSFLSGMTLKALDLAGNDIADFTPIAKVKGLEELNLSATGLKSLELVMDMDLTTLVAANNPISDLGPISNMSRLSCLYIQNTNVNSLNALRNLKELEELDIGDLEEEISLEPLYEHTKLKRIYCWWTTVSDEDRQRFENIMR